MIRETPFPGSQITKKLSIAFIPYYEGNPYQNLLRAAIEDFGCSVELYPQGMKQLLRVAFRSQVDVVHLHWPDPFILGKNYLASAAKCVLTYLLFLIIKLRRMRVVWTVHNLHNHENRFANLERVFVRAFAGNIASSFIVHCEAAKQMLVKELGETLRGKTSVVEHGHYLGSYRNDIDKKEARKKLGWDEGKSIFLFVGNVRLYKGILELIDAFENINDSSILVIAGKVREEAEQRILQDRIANASQIKFEPGFIADERLSLFLAAADVFVAPFRDVLTSGSVVLAMSYGLPVIAPRLGCLPETLAQQKEFTYCPKEKDGLRHAIECAHMSPDLVRELGSRNLQFCKNNLSWERIGRLTACLYREALKPSSGY